MKKDIKKIAIIFWVFGAIGIAIGSLLPHFAPPEQYHLDKLVHGSAYAVLAFLPYIFTNSRKAIFIYLAAIIAMGGGIEILQNLIPDRSGTIGDFAADFIGVLVGVFFATRIKPYTIQWFK